MAELLLGPLLSALKDKASSYLLDKYNVMEGMEKQHKILKRKLPAILDIITDAEEQAVHREGAKAWLEELKMVSYDANQVFEEFKYEALRRQAKENGHYTKLGFDVIKLFPTHNRVVFRYRMGHKLREIVQAIEVLVAEMNAFGFKYQQQASAFKQWRQTDSIVVDPDNIVSRSRDAEKQKIIQIIVNATANLTVLPIVGIGGLGKTTLTQLIYNDPQVQRHFQHQRWVCVSDVFDVYALARKICPGEDDNDKLREELTGKRFFIVLDDVWNRDVDKWNKLKACLQHGATGSVILVTTRIKETAQIMGTTQEQDITVLDNKFIKEIIETRAFSLQKRKLPPDLLDEFVKRCSGSPLAAKALGSVLRTKSSPEQWKVVLDESICTEESGILPILKLSYDDLPSHMKQCFAFCAVFPKDYEIDVEKLIQLWIANGFIQAHKDVSPESIGIQIFNELTSRSFFQNMKQVHDLTYSSRYYNITHSRTICTIHDLMHDVALSIKKKECVIKTEEPSQIEWLSDTARHVFLSCQEPNSILNDALKKGSPAIQTLLCDNYIGGPLQHLSKYNSMQALRLRQFNQQFLMKAKHLRHLRYLDLSGSEIRELPGDISILYNLQTLNLSYCGYLRRLPRQMKYMAALRHLYTHGCSALTSMPTDLGKLTSLQTLTCFVAGSGSDCSNVGEIQNLNLGGELEVCQLENITEADANVANFTKLKRLKKITLTWTPSQEEDQRRCDLEVLEGLTPHDGLQDLRIYAYEGTTFPDYIGMLRNMVRLSLVACNKCGNLPLCSLPALQVLGLNRLLKLRWLCSRDASFNLPNLKELSLEELPDLERWWEIDEPQGQHIIIFPQLEKLDITRCPKLTALPGQQTFPNLESVRIYNSSEFIIVPKAPKLSVLDIGGANQHMSLCTARCMASLTVGKLYLDIARETTSLIELTDGEEKWNHKSPLLVLELSNCDVFFRSSALAALWTRFVQLQQLVIWRCDVLVHWPEKEFESLASLMTLTVGGCKNLTGYAREASMSQLLPCLESMQISCCKELVEIFNVSGSIKKLKIYDCDKVESIFRKQQGTVQEWELSPTVVDYITASTCVPPEPSAAAEREIFLPPCLQELRLVGCGILSGVLIVPPSLKKMTIWDCNNLQSISCQLDELQTASVHTTELPSAAAAAAAREHFASPCAELPSMSMPMPPSVKSKSQVECRKHTGGLQLLEEVYIRDCGTLASLPDDQQSYSSLQYLAIKGCPALKTLPMCLQQQLSSLFHRRDVDARYLDEEPETEPEAEPESEAEAEPKPATWKYGLNKCLGLHQRTNEENKLQSKRSRHIYR